MFIILEKAAHINNGIGEIEVWNHIAEWFTDEDRRWNKCRRSGMYDGLDCVY